MLWSVTSASHLLIQTWWKYFSLLEKRKTVPLQRTVRTSRSVNWAPASPAPLWICICRCARPSTAAVNTHWGPESACCRDAGKGCMRPADSTRNKPGNFSACSSIWSWLLYKARWRHSALAPFPGEKAHEGHWFFVYCTLFTHWSFGCHPCRNLRKNPDLPDEHSWKLPAVQLNTVLCVHAVIFRRTNFVETCKDVNTFSSIRLAVDSFYGLSLFSPEQHVFVCPCLCTFIGKRLITKNMLRLQSVHPRSAERSWTDCIHIFICHHSYLSCFSEKKKKIPFIRNIVHVHQPRWINFALSAEFSVFFVPACLMDSKVKRKSTELAFQTKPWRRHWHETSLFWAEREVRKENKLSSNHFCWNNNCIFCDWAAQNEPSKLSLQLFWFPNDSTKTAFIVDQTWSTSHLSRQKIKRKMRTFQTPEGNAAAQFRQSLREFYTILAETLMHTDPTKLFTAVGNYTGSAEL